MKKELFSVRTKLSYKKHFFSDNLLATEIERAQIFMNKSIYLGLAKLISKIVLYDKTRQQ